MLTEVVLLTLETRNGQAKEKKSSRNRGEWALLFPPTIRAGFPTSLSIPVDLD